MDEALRTRTASKARLTRSVNKLKELLSAETIDILKIKEEKLECEDRLKIYDDAQRAVELLLTDEEQLTESIESSEDFRELKKETLIEAQRVILNLETETRSVKGDIANIHRSRSDVNARLPIIDIPKFNGDPTKWQTFWDKFQAIVDSSDLSAVNKFSYLQSFLQDEALACIAGISLTDDNYESAKELLQKRFGRKEKIIFSHIQKLLSVSQMKTNNLWTLYDKVQASVRSLESLGIMGGTYGVILTPMILCQLPNHIRLEWARSSENKEGDLDFLLDFLFNEIQRRERSHVFNNESHNVVKEKRKSFTPGSASALVTNETKSSKCVFCHHNHYSDKCEIIRDLDHDQRKEKVKSLKLCFRCLGGSHTAHTCNKQCYYCKGPHHSILHIHRNARRISDQSSLAHSPSSVGSPNGSVPVNLFVSSADSRPTSTDAASVPKPRVEQSDCNINSGVTHVADSSNLDVGSENSPPDVLYSNSGTLNTIMQVVQTQIRGQIINVLFDSGSDRSFVKSSTAAKLGLQPIGKECLALSSFGGHKQEDKNCSVFSFQIGNTSLKLLSVKQITSPLFRTAVPKHIMNIIKDIPVKENLSVDNVVQIDMLIGLDFYWEILGNCETKVIETTGLIAQESKFGWFLSGSYDYSKGYVETCTKTNTLFCITRNDPSDEIIRRCWELDSIGIGGEVSEPEHTGVLNDFSKEIRMNGDRYQVGLPWKSDAHKEMLVNNVDQAEKRLTNLSRKLDLNPDLREKYFEVFDDLEKRGIIREVLPEESDRHNPVFYLPHRPVVRESSQTTKVRPVFDASAKGINGVSLNNCLDAGPKMIPDLLKVLLRFRRWKFGLTADITKAFLQIELREEDQDVHRFLLNKNNQVRHMKFTRVTFGNTSSPFLLNATLKFHLSGFEEDRTIQELRRNLYVDDWISGSDDETELMEMVVKAEHVLRQGSFPLTKWASNSTQVKESLRKFFDNSDQNEIQKVLGMIWNTFDDCFQFETSDDLNGLLFTKRKLLGLIARQFDPLGLLTPFTVTLKIFFSRCLESWL